MTTKTIYRVYAYGKGFDNELFFDTKQMANDFIKGFAFHFCEYTPEFDEEDNVELFYENGIHFGGAYKEEVKLQTA